MCSYLQDWYNQELKLNTVSFKNPISFDELRHEENSKEYICRSLQVLVSRGVDVNTRDSNGATLLHYYIIRFKDMSWSKGCVTLIQCILEMKADPNMTITYENSNYVVATRTTLKAACSHVPSPYTEQVVLLLLDAGAIVQPKMFMKYNMVNALQKCQSMGIELYWPIHNFLLDNNNNHSKLHLMNQQTDMLTISTIKILLQRRDRQFHMQVDSLWGLILSFVHPSKKRKLYLHLQVFTSRIITIVTCDIGYMFSQHLTKDSIVGA